MKFKEMAERYRKGEATEEEKQQIEEELEKFETLNDLLYDELGLEGERESENAEKDEPGGGEQLAKLVKKEIRKVYRRIGIGMTAVILAVLLFVQYGLSPLMDQLYYNPLAQAEEYVNQFGLDMMVYSELFLPLRRYDSAEVTAKGFGTYEFVLRPTVTLKGQTYPAAAGRLERNKLTFYTPQTVEKPFGNIMGFSTSYADDMIGGGSWAAEEQLEELKEGEIRRVYFTFAEDLEYEQCMEMEEAYSWGQAWYGVRVSDAYMGYGFSNHAVGPIFEDPEINKSYPGLLDTVDDGSWNDEEERRQEEARARQEHFFSMVRYLGDQSVFTRMMGEREIPVKEITEYIDQNGFRLYGCVIMADKELIQKMSEDERIYCFYIADE